MADTKHTPGPYVCVHEDLPEQTKNALAEVLRDLMVAAEKEEAAIAKVEGEEGG